MFSMRKNAKGQVSGLRPIEILMKFNIYIKIFRNHVAIRDVLIRPLFRVHFYIFPYLRHMCVLRHHRDIIYPYFSDLSKAICCVYFMSSSCWQSLHVATQIFIYHFKLLYYYKSFKCILFRKS